MKREQATLYLLKNNIFSAADEGTPAMKFYIRDLTEHGASILDADCHAHLNTLFGHDIGFDRAMAVTGWLWDPNANGTGRAISVTELTRAHEEKELLRQCEKALCLGLSFEKWKTGPVNGYVYF